MEPSQTIQSAGQVQTTTSPIQSQGTATFSRRRWIVGGVSVIIIVVLVVIGIRIIKKKNTPLTPLQQLEALDKETYQLDQLPPKEVKTTLQELKKNSAPTLQSREQQAQRLEELMKKKQ